jgi:hypothetical protein
VQEWVNSLFLDVLGRDADIVTLRRVAGQVMEGRAMADVRIELATSAEARQAVNQIYRDILRREADPSGLNAQMAALRGGLTLLQIRQAIADSPEGRNRREVVGRFEKDCTQCYTNSCQQQNQQGEYSKQHGLARPQKRLISATTSCALLSGR